jgi:hypothetical protein
MPEPAPTNLKAARKRLKLRSFDEYWVKAIQVTHAWKDQFWCQLPSISVAPDQLPNGYLPDLANAYINACSERMSDVVGAAERILSGEILVFSHALHLCESIPWHRDFIHGKTAPQIFWRNIPFLDAAEVGDSKVIWELNRLQFLLPVAKAFFLTGDRRFYDWIRSTFMSWHRANPYPLGINWSSSLELAFRCITLDWIVRFCRNELQEDREFCEIISASLALHGRHIARFLSIYFSPNTHLTGEALALYLLGTRYRFLPGAAKWRTTGRQVLLKCADIHILNDGGYFERSTWYHRYAIEIYLLFSIIAHEAHDALPNSIRSKLAQMADFLFHSCRDDGTFPLIGDDDGGRLIALDDYAVDDARGILALLAAYLARSDFKHVAGKHDEAIWWLLGEEAAGNYVATIPQLPAARGAIFAETGYAFLRDNWSLLTPNTHLSFDAGPHGVANCGHAHADALSFTLSIGSEHVIVDPGTYSYSIDWKRRNILRGEEAHSGLYIHGHPQNVPDSRPFHWTHLRGAATLEHFLAGEMYQIVQGSYAVLSGSLKLAHSRKMFFANTQQFVLIWDTLTGCGTYDGYMQFILNGTNWNLNEGKAHTLLASGTHFLIQPLCLNTNCAAEIAPIELSPRYLETTKGCRLRFRRRFTLPDTHVTLIAWGDRPRHIATRCFGPNLVQLSESNWTVWCHAGALDRVGYPIASDASASMVLTENNRLSAAEAHNVTELSFQQKPLIQRSRRLPHWRESWLP